MGEISEWLQEALLMAERRRKNPSGLRIVVETEEGKTKEVEMELRKRGYNIIGSVLNFIVVEVKEPADIETVAKLPHVVYVSYEKKFSPTAYGLDELIKRIAIAMDPLLNKLSAPGLEKLGYSFKPASEIPNPFRAMIENIETVKQMMSDPINAMKYIKTAYPFGPPVITRVGWRLVTYTRELMGVPKDNQLKKTFVGGIDSGVRYGPGLGSPAEIETVPLTMLPEPPIDMMSHGCLRNVKVYTSYCGIIDLEELWNKIEAQPIPVKDGEFKPFEHPVYTIDANGVVVAEGVFRVKCNKKVVIETPFGTIEATPWHEFYVAKPKEGRWSNGYYILRKRADRLEAVGNNSGGDWLLFKAYNGESWSVGGDAKLAYLGGLIAGDGTIIFNGVNLETGHVYSRNRNEIMIYDKDKTFLEKLKEIYGGSVYKCNNSYVLRIYGKDFIEKVVPYLKPPINDLEALRAWVAGFFDAEGYVELKEDRPSDRIKICNTDKKLLELLRDVLTTVGVPCSIWDSGVSKGSHAYHLAPLVPQLFYKFVEPYVIKRKDQLEKSARSTNLSKSDKKLKFDGKNILVPVKSVKIVDCNEYFYDLANTANKNYSASGFIVSNSWIHSCAFGRPALTRYGNFYPVANAPKSVHVKVFTAFGPCSGYQVMKAMEICAKKGCKVVNMSLGGPLTEPVDKDPECKVLDTLTQKYGTIFVVAAGNENGSFEICTPGAALKALTVAALDWKNKYKTSSYSSRGWQGQYYKKHKDVFEEHLEKYGDIFLKPDCGGIGGDRDSQIVAACCPWYDGVYDFVPDGWDLMIGTSMATPHVAGLVALAIDRGLLPQNVDKIKEVLRKTAEKWIFGGEIMEGKSVEQGWGLFHWSRIKEYREIVERSVVQRESESSEDRTTEEE